MTDRKAMQLLCFQKAEKLWHSFDKNEQTAVRFGMFPAGPMQEAIKEGFDSQMLAVALMDRANRHGGMCA